MDRCLPFLRRFQTLITVPLELVSAYSSPIRLVASVESCAKGGWHVKRFLGKGFIWMLAHLGSQEPDWCFGTHFVGGNPIFRAGPPVGYRFDRCRKGYVQHVDAFTIHDEHVAGQYGWDSRNKYGD
jgi:hypothetical protein